MWITICPYMKVPSYCFQYLMPSSMFFTIRSLSGGNIWTFLAGAPHLLFNSLPVNVLFNKNICFINHLIWWLCYHLFVFWDLGYLVVVSCIIFNLNSDSLILCRHCHWFIKTICRLLTFYLVSSRLLNMSQKK